MRAIVRDLHNLPSRSNGVTLVDPMLGLSGSVIELTGPFPQEKFPPYYRGAGWMWSVEWLQLELSDITYHPEVLDAVSCDPDSDCVDQPAGS